MPKYYKIYKPFGMLSQFSPEGDKAVLKDLAFQFDTDIYPVGRLDADSEGLLLLTNDKRLNHLLLDPKFEHTKVYLVQVEGLISKDAIELLERGVEIKLNDKLYKTRPAKARVIEEPDFLAERNPPIRFRKSIPTSWIELKIHEGKNRQVRKMTAQTGFPTLRLVRWKIEKVTAENMKPGDVVEIPGEIVYRLLNLK